MSNELTSSIFVKVFKISVKMEMEINYVWLYICSYDYSLQVHVRIQRGVQGVRTPPEKSQKI